VTLDAQVIGAVFTGLIGLVAGFSTWTAARSRRVVEDQRLLRKQVRVLQRQLVATVEHIFALELLMAQHGLPVPERPAILEANPDDDEGDAPDRAPDRTRGGRHSRQE
jgi:hypothetical protein